MRPTQVLRGGGDVPLGKHGKYLGQWGHFGGARQKGIITHQLSANRQRPFAGAWHDAIFNTWRRTRAQIPYFVPPALVLYFVVDWADKRNHYLNSKEGRAEFAGAEED